MSEIKNILDGKTVLIIGADNRDLSRILTFINSLDLPTKYVLGDLIGFDQLMRLKVKGFPGLVKHQHKWTGNDVKQENMTFHMTYFKQLQKSLDYKKFDFIMLDRQTIHCLFSPSCVVPDSKSEWDAMKKGIFPNLENGYDKDFETLLINTLLKKFLDIFLNANGIFVFPSGDKGNFFNEYFTEKNQLSKEQHSLLYDDKNTTFNNNWYLYKGFKPTTIPIEQKEETWNCPNCTFENSNLMTNCEICQNTRNSSQWPCPKCTFENSNLMTNCEICGTPKPKSGGKSKKKSAKKSKKKSAKKSAKKSKKKSAKKSKKKSAKKSK